MFTASEILSVAQNNQDKPLIKADVKSTRTFKHKSSTIFYIPIKHLAKDGEYKPLTLEFKNQLLGSNAKLPHGTTAKDAKFANVSFMKLTDIDCYTRSKELLKLNHEFIAALEQISQSYVDCVEDQVITDESGKFKVASDKINNFVQRSRIDEDDNEIELDTPIFRVRLPSHEGDIGTCFNDKFNSIVFDVKLGKDIPATVKKMKLNLSNVADFVTHQSISSGIISFESIVLSKSGISLRVSFKSLHLMHKKPKAAFSIDTSDMAGFDEVNDSDSD